MQNQEKIREGLRGAGGRGAGIWEGKRALTLSPKVR